MNLDDCAAAGRYCSVKCSIHSCFHFFVTNRKNRFNPTSIFKELLAICIPHFKINAKMCRNIFFDLINWEKKNLFLNLKANSWNREEEIKTLVHAISKLQVFEIKSTLFLFSVPVVNKAGSFLFRTLAVLLPQNQMNAMIRHASGKHQACIILAIKAIEPRGDAWQETGASFGFAVGWQRPAACNCFSPQVHYIQVVVVKQQSEHLTKAEKGGTGWVLLWFDNSVRSMKDILHTGKW